MSDQSFRALRDEAEVAAVPPEFAVVEKRLARKRARTRYATAVAAVAVLVLSFGWAQGAPFLRSLPVGPPDGADRHGDGAHVQFVDTRHGIAQYPPSGQDCRVAVRHTTDGGKTWSEVRYSPPVTRANGTCANLVQLVDGDTIVAPQMNSMPVAEKPAISHDGGKTWQPYEPQVRTVDTVPEGVSPTEICLSAKECNQEGYSRLGWVDAETGDRMVLRTSPPDMKYVGEPFVARDGSIWALEPTEHDRPVELTVAVSQDRGRTWRTTATPDRGYLASYDGGAGYFMTIGPQVQLLRTRDGGATWKQVKDVRFEGADLNWIDVLWVAADGALVVGGYAEGDSGPGDRLRWRASSDGGKTFRAIQLPSGLSRIAVVAGGFHGWGISGSPHYISEDGLTWRETTPPPPFD